jgi:hypothetical protein
MRDGILVVIEMLDVVAKAFMMLLFDDFSRFPWWRVARMSLGSFQ